MCETAAPSTLMMKTIRLTLWALMTILVTVTFLPRWLLSTTSVSDFDIIDSQYDCVITDTHDNSADSVKYHDVTVNYHLSWPYVLRPWVTVSDREWPWGRTCILWNRKWSKQCCSYFSPVQTSFQCQTTAQVVWTTRQPLRQDYLLIFLCSVP